jgi:hypothetical protein
MIGVGGVVRLPVSLVRVRVVVGWGRRDTRPHRRQHLLPTLIIRDTRTDSGMLAEGAVRAGTANVPHPHLIPFRSRLYFLLRTGMDHLRRFIGLSPSHFYQHRLRLRLLRLR